MLWHWIPPVIIAIALSVYFSLNFALKKHLLSVFAIGDALQVNPGVVQVVGCQLFNDLLSEVELDGSG